ncbi:uncharacterized protein LOC133196815 [Saccostrea echinata]|uniref:uncharacterized protein LOC133196815 n=1 Tax=Saccostrea echinata TaxID=191078 RepID=UPI002A835EFE|nr:uncharacterized protein LOC133196815 [Saccostrea echinata]
MFGVILSEIAGAKITEGNPSITDLSDPNRPIKLAERFGELYDGPWTDVLEEFTKGAKNTQQGIKLEREVIDEMQTLLRDISSVCTETAENIIKDITRSLRLKQENVSYELRQAMTSLRKLASQTSTDVVTQVDCIFFC